MLFMVLTFVIICVIVCIYMPVCVCVCIRIYMLCLCGCSVCMYVCVCMHVCMCQANFGVCLIKLNLVWHIYYTISIVIYKRKSNVRKNLDPYHKQ